MCLQWPGTVGQLMSYLGMVNFYRRFTRGASGVLKPLMDAQHGASSKAARIEWTPPTLQAFEGNKQQMVHPGKKAKLALFVDASGMHRRVGLQQELSPGGLQPLGVFSRKLNMA